MRQRIQPQTTRGAPDALTRNSSNNSILVSSWEITSDEGGETNSTGVQPIPMYNPLHYTDGDKNIIANIPAPPGSFPLAWHASQQRSSSTTMIPAAPSSLTGLRSSQLPSLTPAVIPDSSYQAYLMGRPFQKKQKSLIDKICFAKFCAAFSWVAVMFLVFIGILIDCQPLFIQGVLPKHVQYTTGDRKAQVFYAASYSERLEPASHAYQAAFGYFLTGCFSLAYAYDIGDRWGWFKNRRRRSLYSDIPDADSTVPTFHTHLDAELPTTANDVPGGNSPMMRAYQYNNRLSARIWKALSLSMNRVGIYLVSMWPHYEEQRRARRRQAGPKDV